MRRVMMLLLILLHVSLGFVFGQNSKIDNLVKEGIVFHDNGEYSKAIDKYMVALAIDPKSSTVNYEISYSYLASGDYKSAIKYSKKVIEIDDGNVLGGYMTYGSALDLLGKTKRSIKVYEEAMEDFDNYLLYYNHAISCLNVGEVDKAYDSAIKAITNNSSHPSSHLILSKIMEMKGSRVKAMLPLYYFLLVEPASERATTVYQTLKNYAVAGIEHGADKNINVTVPMDSNSDFEAAELMISLSRVSSQIDNENKTELQLFADQNDSIFKVLGELKKDNSGFWWDFYVSTFYNLAEADLTETFSYYISISQGEEPIEWLTKHSSELDRFDKWLSE